MLLTSRCFFFYRQLSTIFGGKVDFTDKVVMYVDSLYAVAAGFVRFADKNLVYKFVQNIRGQFCRFGVLLNYFQKALDIDGLCLCGFYNGAQAFNRLLQLALLLFAGGREPGKPFIRQLSGNIVLVELLNDHVQLSDPPLPLLQLALSEHLKAQAALE